MATTAANEFRWQLRALAALGVMVEHGVREDLPPLTWTVATTGAVTGVATGVASAPGEQREAVAVWAAYLGAEVGERVDRDGAVHLYGNWKWPHDGMVGGAIRATIFLPLDDEGGESS